MLVNLMLNVDGDEDLVGYTSEDLPADRQVYPVAPSIKIEIYPLQKV